jgi:urea ABC transporter urea binding protein
LHSLSGTMAISEAPLVDAELMAIAEINHKGGILGQLIKPVLEDGESNPAQFERKARNLIQLGQVNTVFGCWASICRKAVLPVLEEFNALLWYPVKYEGLECSKNIFYIGSVPNQQIEPAITWLLSNKRKKFYLLGSDEVFSRAANKMVKAQLKHQGGTVVGEKYVPLGTKKFTDIISTIEQIRPDVVFNTLNGDSNIAFYRQYQNSGITADEIPIVAVNIAEAELQKIGDAALGHYASWSYFQSLNTPRNRRFVQKFRAKYGPLAVTSDPIEAAYTQVYLWKQAVELAQSFEVDRVRVAAYGQSFEAPGGLIQIEPNHHVGKTCRIGQISPHGQFKILWSSKTSIKPLPWLGVEELKVGRLNVEGSDELKVGRLNGEGSDELKVGRLNGEGSNELKVGRLNGEGSDELKVGRLNVEGSNELKVESVADRLQSVNLQLAIPEQPVNFQPDRLRSATPESDRSYRWDIVTALLADLSQGIYKACLLKQKFPELEAAWTQPQSAIAQHPPVETVLWDASGELHALFAAMTDVVIVLNARGHFLKIIPSNPNLLYQSPDVLIGKRLHDVFLPAQADSFLSSIQQALETKQTIDIEYHLTLGERTLWLATSISPISDNSVIGVTRDITERKQAEEALRASEERYRSVIAAMAEGIILYKADGKLSAWNKAAERILGMSTEQMMGWTAIDPRWRTIRENGSAFPGELHPAMVTLRTGKPQSNVVMGVQKPDGTLTWISINSQPLFQPGEAKPYAVVTSLSDFTERKQVEEALRNAEERYRSIFENIGEGLFQVTPEGQFLSANPALAQIYGYDSPEELIEKITDVNQQLYVEKSRRAIFLSRLQTYNTVTNFVSQVYRKDGNLIWISENAHVVRDAEGKELYYEGSVVDITVRKVWEEALRYQRECTEQLLLNILPEPIAQRLKLQESTIADSFASVTVLFADLINFTETSSRIPATKLVKLLNKIFSEFDRLSEKHGLEKIKTIGDAYMVVGGLPMHRTDHAEAIAEMALDMQKQITRFKGIDGKPFRLRIGINTGPVVAGIIGTKKFTYDLWGDTVNVASRMESQGIAGRIQVTANTYKQLKDKYLFEKRGIIPVKGKGEMVTYWLTGRKNFKS